MRFKNRYLLMELVWRDGKTASQFSECDSSTLSWHELSAALHHVASGLQASCLQMRLHCLAWCRRPCNSILGTMGPLCLVPRFQARSRWTLSPRLCWLVASPFLR